MQYMDHLRGSDLFNCGLYCFLFLLSVLSDVCDMDGVDKHVSVKCRDHKGQSVVKWMKIDT